MADQANTAGNSKVESVKMQDGRIVDFPGKRKMVKESFIDDASGQISVRIDFRNGETRTLTLPEVLVAKFAAHGAEQKYGDETAGLEDIDDMVMAVDELDARLQKGEWNVRREGAGVAGTSILVRALVEFFGGKKTVDQVKTFLSAKTQAEKMALRANAKVKPIIDRLEQERASKAAKVDTDSMLNELETA